MSAELAPPTTVERSAPPELTATDTDETRLEGNEDDTQLESQSGAPPTAEQPSPPAPVGSGDGQAARQDVLARIRSSSALPPGLQARLADVVAASPFERAGTVAIDDVLSALEAGLPALLGSPRLGASRPQHPSGEGFFFGRSGELTEQEAEALAHGQLTRSGLLRGQRVRVAQD